MLTGLDGSSWFLSPSTKAVGVGELYGTKAVRRCMNRRVAGQAENAANNQIWGGLQALVST
jgi:hypothetical protein